MGVDVATVKNLGEKQQTLRLRIDSDDVDVLEKMRKFVLEFAHCLSDKAIIPA